MKRVKPAIRLNVLLAALKRQDQEQHDTLFHNFIVSLLTCPPFSMLKLNYGDDMFNELSFNDLMSNKQNTDETLMTSCSTS